MTKNIITIIAILIGLIGLIYFANYHYEKTLDPQGRYN